MQITLKATTCNIYKYVVKTFCRSKQPGIYLAALNANGNAARWGLQTGDVIYGADNLLWADDPFVLNRALCDIYDGKTVTLQVVRNGEEIEIKAEKNKEETLTTMPAGE
jgi:S1-C subfamily serine protease